MLDSLPNQPLRHGTVEALDEAASVENVLVLCGLGMGSQNGVIQFALQTGSNTRVLCFAAPDDDEREGWFELAEIGETGRDGLAEASQIAAEYMEQYDQDAYLERHLDVDVENREKDVNEVTFEV